MIELQYFTRSDFNQLIHWVNSPDLLLQWAGSSFTWPLDINQLEKYIKDANAKNTKSLVYKVVLKETGDAIGHISMTGIDLKNCSARIGRVLIGDKNIRGNGIGQLMMKEILEIAFAELGLHRVSLGVFEFNRSAISCYEKVGFKKEGVLRDYLKVDDDEYWDLREMSILEREWLDTFRLN
ncbi:Protein N-acetyltransferase, RimJ/RimL family [Oceanobacillus limi]|uniref:Protein N-acetyltransferase, RimJ/RimL family n=1 Tax=Oceanobacillus limi TaxID=930131 RepID=A0A1I0CDE7_9BACI|nr:GNAT family protein [Oceanobacillus limi]SET17587.1 Protein N-acetyltransferase, RimJ/RimL family [Oceanobacillus limi]